MALCSNASGLFTCPRSGAYFDKSYCCGIPGLQFCCDFSTYTNMAAMAIQLGKVSQTRVVQTNCICDRCCNCGIPTTSRPEAEILFGPGYKGIIAAIVIAGLVVIMLFVLLFYGWAQRRKRNKMAPQSYGSGQRLNESL